MIKKNRVTNNYPLGEGKGNMYEGGVRVPSIIVAPDMIEKGTKSYTPMISMDYYPTLLEFAGLELPSSIKKELDGIISLLPIINNEKANEREAIFWHYPHYHNKGAKPHSAVRKRDWKLIRQFENDSYELYNLNNDVSEEQNLLNENPEKVQELKELLFKWYIEVCAQFPTENPKYDPNIK